MKYLFKYLREINKLAHKSLPRRSYSLSTLRIVGTLIVSGAFLAPQILLPPQSALADKTGICAVPGKDGVGTISGILNSYYPGATGATVAVGAMSIPVGAINSAGSTTPIAAGDLLLIIQMQDAAIDSTNSDAYGNGVGGDVTPPAGVTTVPQPLGASGWTNLNKAGRYEYAVATGPVSGGAIPISQGTVNSYSQSTATTAKGQSTYQVVRIPQYSSGTISGAVTTSARWNGSSGGIVAFDVAGQLNLGGGTVDVNGLGFRGGGTNKNGVTNGGNAQTNYRSTDTGAGTGSDAPKGEGIAGTPRLVSQQPFGSFNVRSSTVTIDNSTQGYPNGDDGRGAPANAGGGGNEHNSGGGGGANGGNGGLGGRSFTYTGGGTGLGYYVGGFGGTALTADPTRLVMGGGGGAGDVNDQVMPSGSGGGGGGMVFIRAGSVSGTATINARGADGIDSPGGANPDAGGGGGAGGTALITAAGGSLAGLTINATGGTGGDLNENGTNETDGPGGGGGGGAVYTTGGVTANVSGGTSGLIVNGTVNNNTSNGATAGTSGINQTVTAASLTTSISGSAGCVPQLTVTKTTSTPTTTAGGTATYTITVANAANRASATQVDISDALPAGFTYASVGSVNLTGGATRTTTTNPTVGATNPSFGQFTIPGGGQVQITFTVNVVAGKALGTYQNPATATYLDPTRTTTNGTTTATYNSASSTGEDVTIIPPPVTVSGTVFSDADADVTINGSDAGSNAGSANLTIYAVDTSGKVLDKITVAANGTYSLANVPANSSVTLRLSNDSTVAIGATAPTASTIPSGWYYTGENKNGTVDGTIATLGNIALTTTTSNLTNQNFGIRQAYTITADPAPTTCNPDYRTALNTGITAAGGQLAVGAYDLNWTAEWIAGPASGPGTPYAPPRPVGVMPAVVVGKLASTWVTEPTNPANARWISYPFRLSVNTDGYHNDADLDGIQAEGNSGFSGPGTSDDVRLKFTSTLTLPSNANTISISLPVGVAIDNQFVSIKVNGVENLVPTPAANPIAADYGTTKTVNITNGWQAGVNTIEIIADSGPDRVGFFLAVQATTTQVCTNPNVLLVKRITAINGDRTKNPNDNTPLNTFVDDTTSTRKADDNNANWKSGYLVGAIDGGKVKPGDEIEYTIYFLNAGSVNANTVKVCDRISANQNFKVGAYGTSKDMQLQLGTSTVLDLTSASDTADRAQLISAGGSVPANCYLKATNDNGTLVIDVTGNTGVPNLTTMPGSTGQGSPNDSYGFLRFITKVKP
ncbi:hypothetical protein NIES4072_06110 [Nostoc commune NIES-4072]|uniref:DUF11 domain-containing protein n=1 Tax=Nostoc commune NIES-4072 TaxID=2005467 RepID=A0A2R5FMW9_NOSCO|nr:isopeptide-forming domain-containing fimbrial protein [Nostoc commune]BBD65712.1 hypothetical protein NIES4070_20720 [Nostoc commune HK-02]GBG16964.1 hypothetical protein NIES4072_06110 [Nostoc commune NIES-4072]